MIDRIVGIDLGTSNTVVAYVDELDRVKIVPDAEGGTVHPSVVSFHPAGGVVVGVAGKQRKLTDPENTIFSAKRMIGQPFKSHAVQETARRVPFAIVEGPNSQAMVTTRAGEFAIPEVSAIVLDHVRKLASSAMRTEVARAVVTVPASFTDVQRSSTATAGALAGLTVVRVLNEPTAAAIAYGSTKRLDEVIAVYDWGGGTFDITILRLQDQVYTVLGTSGDAFLGGEDMDERLVDRMIEIFLAEHRIDLRTDEVAMMRLRAVAEHTKIELSRRSRALVKIEEIAFGPGGKPIDLEAKLSRDELVASIGDLTERTFASCKEAMVLAGISQDRVADVVLVGGATRVPFVREQVARFFGREPRTDMNPEDAIATGAALQAASIEQMLARAPARPIASIPIPLDDFDEEPPAGKPVEVEPERAPSKIAEVKRPKRGTDMFSGGPRSAPERPARRRPPSEPDAAKTAARGKAFFGDLFGDKPAPPVETSMPVIDLADLEEIDDLDEKSGELLIDVEEPAGWSGATPISSEDSGSLAIEIDEPEPKPSVEIDLVMPPARKAAPAALELDWEPPAEPDIQPVESPVLQHWAPNRAPAVVDVTPRSLGIGTVAGFCEELIRRNTQLPVGIKKLFSTARDFQDTVRIVICQGESRRIDRNVLIGDLVLENLPRRRRGETQIEVEFRLDASGILHVGARDVATGTEQRARLDLLGGMAPEAMSAAADRLKALSSIATPD